MIFSNYHTHTLFCDGKNTPEEIVIRAIELGCKEIGFSGHSHTPFDQSYCMSQENTPLYKKAIGELKEKYKGKIEISLGVEQDYYSNEPTDDYDYIIGSVHYLFKDGVYLPVDESKDLQIDAVKNHYDGDFYAFVEDYYNTVAKLYEKTRCNIIGHIDLVTKFNEGNTLFDTSHERYQKAMQSAVKSLADAPVIFEVNTGAVSRGYKSEPFPSDDVLKEIKKYNKEIILTSDCHAKENLLYGFNEQWERLQKSGHCVVTDINIDR